MFPLFEEIDFDHLFPVDKHDSEIDGHEEINDEEMVDAEWDTIVQRHIDMRVLDNTTRNETVWPRDTLFRYLEVMERIMENLHERQEIINLVGSSLLNIHDYN